MLYFLTDVTGDSSMEIDADDSGINLSSSSKSKMKEKNGKKFKINTFNDA